PSPKTRARLLFREAVVRFFVGGEDTRLLATRDDHSLTRGGAVVTIPPTQETDHALPPCDSSRLAFAFLTAAERRRSAGRGRGDARAGAGSGKEGRRQGDEETRRGGG